MVKDKYCPDCQSHHIGSRCGMAWLDRMRTVRSENPSRTKKNYYDKESLQSVFGADAHERMMEETDGIGAVHPEEIGAYPELAGDIHSYYTHGDEVDD